MLVIARSGPGCRAPETLGISWETAAVSLLRRGLWDPLQHSQGLAGRSRDRAGSTRMAITAMKAGPQVPG